MIFTCFFAATMQASDIVQREIAHRFFDSKVVQSLQSDMACKVMLMTSQLCSSTRHLGILSPLYQQKKSDVSVLVTHDLAHGSDRARLVREYGSLPVCVMPQDDFGIQVKHDAIQQALVYEQAKNKLDFLLALIMMHKDAYLVYVDNQGQELWTRGTRESYAELEHALQFRLERSQLHTFKNR